MKKQKQNKKHHRKIYKKIAEFAVFMLVLATLLKFNVPTVFAEGWLPWPSWSDKPLWQPGEGDTLSQTTQLVLGTLKYVKAVMVIVAILYITIIGFQLVITRGNEEDITKAKVGITYSLIALFLISMSEDLARIFDQSEVTVLGSAESIKSRVQLFNTEVEVFITFVKTLIGSFALIMLVRSVLKLVTSGGDEEESTKHRKSLFYSLGGLVLIYIGDIFINKVFYKIDVNSYTAISGTHPQIDVKEGVAQIAGIINLIMGIVAPIAIMMLIIGAVMYLGSAGNEDTMGRAKRLIIATIIGIVIIFGAFAIVSTILNSKLTQLGAIPS